MVKAACVPYLYSTERSNLSTLCNGPCDLEFLFHSSLLLLNHVEEEGSHAPAFTCSLECKSCKNGILEPLCNAGFLTSYPMPDHE